ncbi:MAG: hypothetical protein EZS28_002263 [Streblomastix strix]|uniref:Right handed beta helix domain-containing protein n=1 Tax=Streblomastix strix TaxID=222440 RepID=A0A5J4X4Q8_9EUKA|nr:MAG: hypothetical protein EZS28_002263 [Streblomastix strix]
MIEIFNGTYFYGCEAFTDGGGMYSYLEGVNCKLDLVDVVFQSCFPWDKGAGIYIGVSSGAYVQISETCQFWNCYAQTGGGIYSNISGGGKKIQHLMDALVLNQEMEEEQL